MTDAHRTRRWVLGLAAVASFMVALDTLVVSTALTTIRARPRRERRAARVDGQRLQPELRRAADDGVGARRPLRPAPAVRRRPRAVRARVRRVRARPRRGLADRRARPCRAPARRSSCRSRSRSSAPRSRRSAAASAMGALQGLTGPRGRERPGDRRRGRRRASPGSGSSGSTCRSGSLAVPLVARAASPRAAARDRSLDLPGLALITARRSASSGASCAATAPAGAAPRSLGSLAAGRRCCSARSCGWERARAHADAAARALPLARVLGRQRRDLPDVRVAVRRGVLPRPVPADRARLRPARRRAAAAAVDGDAVLRRARRRARSSTASASARSSPAGSRCRRIGLGWIALVAEPAMDYIELVPPLIVAGCGVSMAMPVGAERGRQRRAPRARSARPRASTARCASSAACSGSRSRSRSSPAPAATRRRRRSATASPPRSPSPRGSRSRGGGRGAAAARAPGGAHSVRRRSSAIVIATLSRAGASTRDPRAARRSS